jgi:SAM-dependent methyltransferase
VQPANLKPSSAPDDWIGFWNAKHSIYVNALHRDVHYRRVAEGICEHVPARARVLDYGCGEALHADRVAASASQLTLCEAAPAVCQALKQRFGTHARIEALSPAEVSALAPGSYDVIVLHSVAQYLTVAEFDELLVLFQRLLSSNGLLVLGDIIPPQVSALTDAAALLRFAARNGFFGAALVGLVRTVASNYWRLRSRLGLTRYSEAAMLDKLAAAGFSARRADRNIGHNPARMTFLARRK